MRTKRQTSAIMTNLFYTELAKFGLFIITLVLLTYVSHKRHESYANQFMLTEEISFLNTSDFRNDASLLKQQVCNLYPKELSNET